MKVCKDKTGSVVRRVSLRVSDLNPPFWSMALMAETAIFAYMGLSLPALTHVSRLNPKP